MKNNWHYWVIGVGSLLLMSITLYMNYDYATGLACDQQGIFGDMFGASNAFFTGLSFTGVIIAILLQRQELKLQRQELTLTRNEMELTRDEFATQNYTMKLQQFENTFFQMLNLSNSIINNSFLIEDENQYVGKQIFDKVNKEISRLINNFAKPQEIDENMTKYDFRMKVQKNKQRITSEEINKIYNTAYQKYRHILAHYFSTLNTIFNFVHHSDISKKNIYIDIIKSQMSTTEKIVFFYNSLKESDEYSEIRKLIKEYNILNDLEFQLLPNQDIASYLK
ncbi:putative phage abortive infection protein [Chryseobacterium gambrini]|uniref:Phage abortive infection protein n=1 Tax=Chryseobacterium gambrini TaxID=373672 RepID=A0ABN7C954_9FLAO|nr:putative phage abortive infection protein [Chryseobacterium gambrini]